MILGSDQRYGDKKAGLKPRSDTIILVRLDPDKDAIAVMSIPRDLKVDIPGVGTDKINAAYEIGGPRLTVKTQEPVRARASEFQINHVVNINFGGFRARSTTSAASTSTSTATTSTTTRGGPRTTPRSTSTRATRS